MRRVTNSQLTTKNQIGVFNMSHCIQEADKGIVGYTQTLGKTWHGLPQYLQIDGAVPYEQAEAIADYNVEKRQLFANIEQNDLFMPTIQVPVENAFCLYRTDIAKVIYPMVGERYTVANNLELLKFVDKGILQKYPNITVESVGTLENGQGFFLNLLVSEYTVHGDVSPTVTRLAVFNFHGGKAVSACIHQTRIVCMNTLRVAQAQGKANATMKNFRHTATVAQRLEDHTINLADIIGETEFANERMDTLAKTKINATQFDMFIENVFPSKDAKANSKTLALNKQDAVRELYEGKEDLVAIDNTAYRALNAVTDWADHDMSLRGDADNQGKRFMSNIDGASDKVKQEALTHALALVS
jgi:phage/plasmid-like protein (TIGR03299 family)